MSERTIVFTGTQNGMTEQQRKVLAKIFARVGRRLLHGCCVGADHEAGQTWIAVKGDCQDIEGFPSNVRGKVADCLVRQRHAPAPPLERNRTMVEEAIRAGDAMCVAAPKGMEEELRSGTWATVRYARKRDVLTLVILPDGSWTYDAVEEVGR